MNVWPRCSQTIRTKSFTLSLQSVLFGIGILVSTPSVSQNLDDANRKCSGSVSIFSPDDFVFIAHSPGAPMKRKAQYIVHLWEQRCVLSVFFPNRLDKLITQKIIFFLFLSEDIGCGGLEEGAPHEVASVTEKKTILLRRMDIIPALLSSISHLIGRSLLLKKSSDVITPYQSLSPNCFEQFH